MGNEPNFEHQMCRMNPRSEFCREPRVDPTGLCRGMRKGSEARRLRKPGAARENTKNRGNKAKESLKTKDFTFCSVQERTYA